MPPDAHLLRLLSVPGWPAVRMSRLEGLLPSLACFHLEGIVLTVVLHRR